MRCACPFSGFTTTRLGAGSSASIQAAPAPSESMSKRRAVNHPGGSGAISAFVRATSDLSRYAPRWKEFVAWQRHGRVLENRSSAVSEWAFPALGPYLGAAGHAGGQVDIPGPIR